MYGVELAGTMKTRSTTSTDWGTGAGMASTVFSTDAHWQEAQADAERTACPLCSPAPRLQTCVNPAVMLNQSQQIRTTADVPRLNLNQKVNIFERVLPHRAANQKRDL
jgi:hypothetical protein